MDIPIFVWRDQSRPVNTLTAQLIRRFGLQRNQQDRSSNEEVEIRPIENSLLDALHFRGDCFCSRFIDGDITPSFVVGKSSIIQSVSSTNPKWKLLGAVVTLVGHGDRAAYLWARRRLRAAHIDVLAWGRLKLTARSFVRSEIFVATRATQFPSPVPPSSDFGAAGGRHIPLLPELETVFDFGCYKYAAPDGAAANFISAWRVCSSAIKFPA